MEAQTELDAEKTDNANLEFMPCVPALPSHENGAGGNTSQRFGLELIEGAGQVLESPVSIVLDDTENRDRTIGLISVATFRN
jgi:ornithine carbamoyltransferase